MSRSLDLSCVDVEDFLESLRIRNISRPSLTHFQFSCPFPGHNWGDENPSAQMREDSTAWNCFGCKRTGNAVTFLAEYEGVNFMEARRWLREQYGGEFREPEGGARSEWEERFFAPERNRADQANKYLDDSVLDQYSVDWADAWCTWQATSEGGPVGYMFERGFEPETLMDWDIGYDEKSFRFTIPVRDEDGRLVGFKGRAWDPDRRPKYLVLGDKEGREVRYGFSTYDKSHYVFGLDRARPGPGGELIAVEGELNTVAMHQKGWPQTVDIAGSSLSDAQSRLLRDHAESVLLFFDHTRPDGAPDKAGLSAMWGYRDKHGRHHPGAVDKLEPFMPVRVAAPHIGDAADMSRDDIATALKNAQGSIRAREEHERVLASVLG